MTMRPKIIETPEEKKIRVKERNRLALAKKAAKHAAVTIAELSQVVPVGTYSPTTMAELSRVGAARLVELTHEANEKRAKRQAVLARRAAKAGVQE
jgi:hypothetical protein